MADFQLILMRHAKSDWSAASKTDHDRCLNARGSRDAPRMGRWISEQEYLPSLVLCSTAVRAKETCELVMSQWDVQVPVQESKQLYLAAPEEILKVIASSAVEAERVMIIGHNPGLEILAGHFSGACGHFPTAAIAVISLQIQAWDKLNPGSRATMLAATRPKEIES